MGKRIVAKVYTQGKFGRRLRETLDRDIFELWTERGHFDPKLLER